GLEEGGGCGPLADFADAKRRVGGLRPEDRAALSSAGAFDFAGKGRQPCVGPWPVAAAVRLHDDRRSEWGALGFCSGPPMMALARRALPRDLADSRALREAQHGQKLRLAGLVAAAEGSS